MSMIIRYPRCDSKIAPKELRCSDCGVTIKAGNIYFRHNHGRYCPKCSAQYKSK